MLNFINSKTDGMLKNKKIEDIFIRQKSIDQDNNELKL